MNYSELFIPVNPGSAVGDTKFEKAFPTLSHSSYEWERAYCTYVQAGDVIGARRFMQLIADRGQNILVGNVSRDTLTQTKYLAVSFIAVVTRVAINSGGDELNIYGISDAFLQSLDDCNDSDILVTKLFHACECIILEVQDAKKFSLDNLHFTRCREYINSHLNQKITVSELADVCQLTPNYLSYLFKKISGQNITEYIMAQRINTAKQLLLSQDNSCAEIASFLGFSSQSYFISCFKKITGMTPRNWKMHHSADSGIPLYPNI